MTTAEPVDGAEAQEAAEPLAIVARLAAEVGSPALAAEANSLRERLAEGRFYVACVGQFKRGKSTLLNALIGRPVLPTGVVPVTAVVTVVRHGNALGARVRFADAAWRACAVEALAEYVSEPGNPGNRKGVTGVEVFVPSPLLASGLCLVDTPGVGSVHAAATAATREFVPHVDAALVVLGADPPISGEELSLLRGVARETAEFVFVLNKADRSPDAERAEAIAFIRRVLGDALGRGAETILEVSAKERLADVGPARDWAALLGCLDSLARRAGAHLVKAGEARGVAAIAGRLRRELEQRRVALLAPIEESEARVAMLGRAVADAEGAMEDLGQRLLGVQQRLTRRLADERDRFVAEALPVAERELRRTIRADGAPAGTRRARALAEAVAVTRRWIDRWREDQEPRVELLYRDAVERLVAEVDRFRATLTAAGLDDLPRPLADVRFHVRSRFHFSEMLAVAPASAPARVLDLLPFGARRWAIERAAARYLGRLFEVNSARIKNDFQERIVESRRRLEHDLRDGLQEAGRSAARSLARARAAKTAGAAAVADEIAGIERLRGRLDAMGADQRLLA
jgi:hypothetical protein